ncbi:MAG: MurR/RpiR family transcriptional regulator, partial [Pseudomonadota bacterium]
MNPAFEDLRNRIADAHGTMPKRLAQAAGFALTNPEEMALGTTATIARAAEVQPSTLVRLAQHLGYSGFSDLQTVFRERLKDRSTSYEERLDRLHQQSRGLAAGSAKSRLDGFAAAARQSLSTLDEVIDYAQFERAVDTLAQADTIYLVARRRAYPVTAHMAYTCGKLGIRTVMVNATNGIETEIAGFATPADAAFVCSFDPYTTETIERTAVLAERSVPIVTVTDSPLSPLMRFASVSLEIAESDYAGFRSL